MNRKLLFDVYIGGAVGTTIGYVPAFMFTHPYAKTKKPDMMDVVGFCGLASLFGVAAGVCWPVYLPCAAYFTVRDSQ